MRVLAYIRKRKNQRKRKIKLKILVQQEYYGQLNL